MQYVFITGGVASSLGKGIASAAVASLLQQRNFKVRIRKLDPYLNVDGALIGGASLKSDEFTKIIQD